jgi:holo-[acyl-carrier protein] synthase
MGILGIGVDVVHIPRVRAFVLRRGPEKLANRILSQQERIDWVRIGMPPGQDDLIERFLAVR